MKKWLALCGLFLLSSCSKSNGDYNQFVEESNAYMLQKIDRCVKDYKIGDYKRFDWNQQTGELVWSDDGVPKVVGKVQFVGSFSRRNNTWLWSWANLSIIGEAKKDILKVKAYGEKHRYDRLTQPGWPADEADGWDMAAVTANVLQAEGAYKAPDSSGNGFTFLVIKEIDWAKRR